MAQVNPSMATMAADSKAATTTTTNTHILVFPYPAQGHMLPLLDLTHHLAIKGNLTVTVLVTPKNLHLLNPLLSSISTHPSIIETLLLPFPSTSHCFSIPPGVENSQDLPGLDGFFEMQTHPSPPVAIISDIFLGWTHDLARELGIQRFVFSPVGALTIAIYNTLWVDLPEPSLDQEHVLSFTKLGHEFPWKHVSPIYRKYVKGDPIGEVVKSSFIGNMKSWGLILNTFNYFDQDYLNPLKKELGHDRVWTVGPLISPTTTINRGGKSSIPVDDVISWLDKHDDNRVVYIGFGSQIVLSTNQMEALALGLEKSNVNFIWSVKEPVDGNKINIPVGFETRTTNRGLIIKGWAPQIQILNHRAVGAYLTHGGWNSMVEGLVMGGVLLLMWPMMADHFTNAQLLVDKFKAAVRVCEGMDDVPDPTELGQMLTDSVNGNGAEKERVVELRRAALAAIDEGGSSVNGLDELVKELHGLAL
ncbi:hypothetical protein ACFE04_010846 [Oxalis oulophora]